MTVDPSLVPGLLFLLAEFAALAAVGYVIVRVALRETDDRVALAQGLIVGPAIWGVIVNLVMYALPGMAGAVAGGMLVLALAVVLVWRFPKPVRPRLRAAAGVGVAALAYLWVGLASRQLLSMNSPDMQIGLAASIRAGVFPPELAWNPGTWAPYHYGAFLLSGLLTPPSGPDLAFMNELFGVYGAMCLFVIVATAVLRHGSGLVMLIAAPLLLTAGAWTSDGAPQDILQAAIPTGLPAAGIRASLTEVYWPSVESAWDSITDLLPDINKTGYTLAYAVSFVVLAHAARSGPRSWLSMATLAALIGFLGLVSTTLTPIVFVLWVGLEAAHLIKSRRTDSWSRSEAIRLACGLVLAAVLLLVGNFSKLVLGDTVTSGLSLGWNPYLGRWRLLGRVDWLPGGVGLVGLGPLAVAGAALLLARRERLVQALAAGAGLFVLVAAPLVYGPTPGDIGRLEGHARNLALFALLVAIGVRLAGLRPPRLRYVACAVMVALVTWPTAIGPVRNASMAVANGIELANAERTQGASARRFVLEALPSDRIADYIRSHIAVDARVFSPAPGPMTFATGRPNASGFTGLVHLKPRVGPEYRDARDYLEPAAVRRLGFDYVHAPDSWVEGLPDEAAARLDDPRFFELLVRDANERLYRVLPEFLSLGLPPAPGSYEALRRAVPTDATVLIRPGFLSGASTRVASALSHARLLGTISPTWLISHTPWSAEPLGDQTPDLVIAAPEFARWVFPPASHQPVWWNDEAAVFAFDGDFDPITPPPTDASPVGVQVSETRVADGRIAFTVTFEDRAPDQWTSQDWVLIATEAQPWGRPLAFRPDGSPTAAMWFVSYLNPGRGTSSFSYEFDFRGPVLAVRREGGVLKALDRSEAVLDSDGYVLAVRLRHEYEPNYWRDAAIIPVVRITVAESGEVLYQVHE